MEILYKIKEIRKTIHGMINLDNILFTEEIVQMSQYLDELIIEYIKCSGEERKGGKE